MEASKRPSLLIIFLTVFIDLVGFGIVMPLLPIYSRQFDAGGLLIGAIMASFSIMQFLFAPIWGRWSDRIGRRPVLLVSLLGSTISYAMFAVASGQSSSSALWWILISRIFAGICGANITVASAYMADISDKENRSKRMGLVGMAFGLGFIFGPAIGSFSANAFGLTGPGWVASAICLLNFLLACFVLKESRKPNVSPDSTELPKATRKGWSAALAHPQIRLLVGLFFIATFCFACFETTLGLLLQDNFAYDQKKIGWFFTFCGFTSAMIQGGLIGRLVKKYGERKLVVASFFVFAAGLMALPVAQSMTVLLISLALFAIGSGMNRPPTFGLISILTDDESQGSTLGVAQSAGSLARIFGPFFAGGMYEFGPRVPYWSCAALALVFGIVALVTLKSRPSTE
jgi:MFS transporter, DHA1 family, tetracycline resistance protein